MLHLGTQCYVYAAISLGELCRGGEKFPGSFDDRWGCINQDTMNEPVGVNSSYVKVEKVGCGDCAALANLRCPDEEGIQPPMIRPRTLCRSNDPHPRTTYGFRAWSCIEVQGMVIKGTQRCRSPGNQRSLRMKRTVRVIFLW